LPRRLLVDALGDAAAECVGVEVEELTLAVAPNPEGRPVLDHPNRMTGDRRAPAVLCRQRPRLLVGLADQTGELRIGVAYHAALSLELC
jgi:hypothetical protein